MTLLVRLRRWIAARLHNLADRIDAPSTLADRLAAYGRLGTPAQNGQTDRPRIGSRTYTQPGTPQSG